MTTLVVGLIVIVGAFIFGGWYNSEHQRIQRELRGASKYKIGDFPDGTQGKVVGRLALHQKELTAPLSGRSCTYFKVAVSEYRSNGDSGSYYEIITEEEGVDFALDDGTGTAIVLVGSARTALTEDHETRSGTLDDPTAREQAYLDAHGQEGEGWLFNKTLRYVEAVLEPGELVSVFGYGSKEPDPDAAPAGYRDAQPMRLRISGSANYPALISDVPSTR